MEFITMLSSKWIFTFIPVLFVIFPCVASSATWEELFSSKTDNAEAKIEMRKSSYKKRSKHGDTIISAHIRTYYREGLEVAKASGDYEIHCASRKAYRDNFKMNTISADRSNASVASPNKVLMEGAEYQEFTSIMEILCAN